MNKTENTLYKKTPSVTVLNNRGLAVRDIVYHRHPDTPDKTDERITRHQFDVRGFLQQSADPRMQASGLTNFHYVTSLSGQVLRTESADAGTSLALNDAAERPLVSISQIRTDNGKDDRSVAVTHTFQYERSGSGRPLSIAEQVAGQSAVVSERFVYAGNSEAEKTKNLAGVCTHHYDPAGLMQTDSIALTGVPLSVTRQLLKDADNPGIAVNWPESNPQALLSAEKYITQTTADATGAVLNTTDAAGHQQKVTYDIAGLLSSSRVTVKGGAEKIIIKSVDYSAAGQKLREEHGNGVVTTYTYEPQTQRLIAVKTEHPARKKIFQDLRYEYDPVGNVLCVTNDAEETRFWHNQKVVPENRYTYDTLYQLVSATGREMANAGQQSGSLPDISPFDKATYTNYTRNYVYDRAGNMAQIRHSAPATGNNYTTDITVSQRSNRAVLKTLADTPDKAEALFTPGGQQTQLQPGQALSWTTRGELRQVTPVVRNGAAGDRESYRYDAGSQRILKAAVQKTGNSTQTQQVIYLPGLELRSGTENYQVICAGVAGRAQVRLLHWPDGKKDHQRFSYDNLIGSSGLETDGDGRLLSQEEYYPFGGTAVLVADTDSGIDYKTHRYSGKERDATGLYYYGYRYYQPWAGRWLSSDPAGTVDGLNQFRMVRNNPVTLTDDDGRWPKGLFDKDYVGTMDINNEKVDIRKSPWPNSYQIGKDSRLTFQLEGVNVDNKTVSFKRETDRKGFNELYQRWKNNDVTLIRGISSNHFSWDKIITDKTVYSEGDNDLPGATMGGSKSRWLPTALDDENNRAMVSGIAIGNHTDTIKDAMHDPEKGSDVLAGAILTFKAGKDISANINFLYDGEIALQGPVKYPAFKIDSVITGDMSPVDTSHIEHYDEMLPLSAPYIHSGASKQDVQVANEMSGQFLQRGQRALAKIRASHQARK